MAVDPFDGSVVLFPEALAEIQGAPDLYMRAGSSLRLVCTLRHSTEPPAFVFWYHEQRMINYDPGVTVKEGRSSSVLLLQDADKSHNGNYTCSPSNAVPASINVHVLNATAGKHPSLSECFSQLNRPYTAVPPTFRPDFNPINNSLRTDVIHRPLNETHHSILMVRQSGDPTTPKLGPT
jgi:hypothetical protein